MNNRFLIRPEVRKKIAKDKAAFLPADLVAAYTSYHRNLAEQRKLEQKIHVIDMETDQMKRDLRYTREVLERELKENEREFWSCHRVFSAATLITDSDSYRKRFYTGPLPTKAKLPRRTLERLSHLIRKLQAEDDLETVLRFQRCARFARRSEDRLKSASSITPVGDGDTFEVDLLTMQHLTESMDDRSTSSVESIQNKSSSDKIRRIRSAPLRVASGKKLPAGLSVGRHSSFPLPSSREKSDEASRFSPSNDIQSSEIALYTVGEERNPPRLAWEEKVTDALVDMVESTVDGTLNVNGMEQSRDSDLVLNQKSRSSIAQARDTENLILTPTDYRTSRSSDKVFFTHQQHLAVEPCFECPQSNETTPAEGLGDIDSEMTTSDGFIISGGFEEEKPGDEDVDRLQSQDITFASTPRKGSTSQKIFHVSKERKSSVPDLQNAPDNEDLMSISEKEGHVRDPFQPESNDECFIQKHAESQRDDNEIIDPRRNKHTEREAKKTVSGTVKRHGLTTTYDKVRTPCQKAQRQTSGAASIALPKSSLRGLSSRRKSLIPRTHHKQPKQQNNGLKKANDVQGARKQSLNASVAKSHPAQEVLPDDDRKKQEDEKQPNVPVRKQRVSIFKRKCLSEVLFMGQVQVESQLRHRVQGFLGTMEDDGDTGKEELTE